MDCFWQNTSLVQSAEKRWKALSSAENEFFSAFQHFSALKSADQRFSASALVSASYRWFQRFSALFSTFQHFSALFSAKKCADSTFQRFSELFALKSAEKCWKVLIKCFSAEKRWIKCFSTNKVFSARWIALIAIFSAYKYFDRFSALFKNFQRAENTFDHVWALKTADCYFQRL